MSLTHMNNLHEMYVCERDCLGGRILVYQGDSDCLDDLMGKGYKEGGIRHGNTRGIERITGERRTPMTSPVPRNEIST